MPVNPTLQYARLLDDSFRDPGKDQSEQVNPPYQARGRWQMAPINLATNRRRVTKSIPGSSESGHDERPSLPAFEMVDVVRMVDNASTLPETTWQVITYRLHGLSQF